VAHADRVQGPKAGGLPLGDFVEQAAVVAGGRVGRQDVALRLGNYDARGGGAQFQGVRESEGSCEVVWRLVRSREEVGDRRLHSCDAVPDGEGWDEDKARRA